MSDSTEIPSYMTSSPEGSEDYELMISVEEAEECELVRRMSGSEESELICYCGLPPDLRVSRTRKNPDRLFYNCSKTDFSDQCGFFQWQDETYLAGGDKHADEITLVRNEAVRLHKRINFIKKQHENERAIWNREKVELTSQLSKVKAELDEMKRIKQVNELDKLSNSESTELHDEPVMQALGNR